jgi:3-oxoacyl-[acyl-carrier-protein] synthase II
MDERVVITGLGTINPVGHSTKETWENITNGISGVGPITLFDASDLNVRIACEVKSYNPLDYMSVREARHRDRFEEFAIIAANQAIAQSGLNEQQIAADRVGVIISTAIGGIETTQEGVVNLIEKGPRSISPMSMPKLMVNGAAGNVAIDHHFQGPSYSVSSACASGSDAIGTGWMLIKAGLIDAAVVGASDATITRIGIATFDRVGAMSRRNQDYSMTPQPFDIHRDGLVMGEGAAILILEKESLARKRGAPIFAELAGYSSTTDANHITAPMEDGSVAAKAIQNALISAKINKDQVDYINAHGTATTLNDIAESKAIKKTFGKNYRSVLVSSTKSMTGHMMGATGTLETIISILSIQDNLVPPTIHFQEPDPECDLNIVANHTIEKNINIVVNNAFGFGGHNSVLVIRIFE